MWFSRFVKQYASAAASAPRRGISVSSHVSYVGAHYGLSNRPLGTVGLLGPLRMDYDTAIRSVRTAAFELSRLVEEVYEEA